ncbi:MAG: electron transfer flavoprotein-ubiquinone oxidoreductase [Kiritimatiellae bacterium]|nr:electron transfer flavoprotein-ubiquinone oxidoreductase [Kiritimatiellia bacterium]
MERESMEFDIVCVGGGVATLSTVLRLLKRIKQSSSTKEKPSVLIIEKAANAGNHALSGAVIDPEPFNELLSDEEIKNFPVESYVRLEAFYHLSKTIRVRLPWIPPMMQSKGFPITSISAVTRYLSKLCEAAGAEIYTGFSAVKLLEENGRITGIQIGDKGLDKDGSKKPCFEAGPNVIAKIVVLGEGSCGKLTEKLITDKKLNEGQNPQTYAIGIKEVIEIPSRPRQKGRIIHTFGYPLDHSTYGGGFIYCMSDTKVAIGMVTALDYSNPTINPHDLFRMYKLHPVVRRYITGGKVIGYGAKVLTEGGYYSAPQLITDGAMIVGDGAGLLDSLRLKGIHIALQSGIAAGDTLFDCWEKNDYSLNTLKAYPEKFYQMSGWKQMRRVKNVHASFTYGMFPGMMAVGMSWATAGILPMGQLTTTADWKHMKPKSECKPWDQVPKSDDSNRELQMDRLTDVFFSGTKHEEHQPCHLKILDTEKCKECINKFGAPCTLFCPAQVYTLNDDGLSIRIDPSNCLHCKTCQIKDPYQNIEWNLPEGGGGPHYKEM